MKQKELDHYKKVSELSLANAERFLKDSIILQEDKSYGHAISFTILGFEELGKAWLGYNIFIGTEDERKQLINEMNENHKIKHQYGWKILLELMFGKLVYDIIKPKFRDSFENVLPKLKIDIIVDKSPLEIMQIDERPIKEIQFICKENGYEELFKLSFLLLKLNDLYQQSIDGILNNLKNNGLYLDFNEKHIINNPFDFTKRSTNLISLLTDLIDFSKSIILSVLMNVNNIPELDNNLELAREFMKAFRALEEKQKG